MNLAYTESQGLPALREEIAGMYGPNVSASEVLVLAPEEGIFLSMQALLQAGDEVQPMRLLSPDDCMINHPILGRLPIQENCKLYHSFVLGWDCEASRWQGASCTIARASRGKGGARGPGVWAS